MKKTIPQFDSKVLYKQMTHDWQGKSERLQARRWRKLREQEED